ncbi:MAG: response regulator [Lachnospiraceae bacterium]|nr:response regulator [Lachnospiraceae bacterium]
MASILIVDDSRTSRKMLRNLLEENGHTVAGEAKDGQEGVNLAKELHPDIITLDITMPVLDGIGALEAIKQDNPNARVIMVTAAGQKDKIVKAVKLGASEFVSKPYEPKLFLDTIEAVMNK